MSELSFNPTEAFATINYQSLHLQFSAMLVENWPSSCANRQTKLARYGIYERAASR